MTTQRRLVMIPGPVEISPAVREAYAVPPPGHLSPEVIEALGASLEMMRRVWQTKFKKSRIRRSPKLRQHLASRKKKSCSSNLISMRFVPKNEANGIETADDQTSCIEVSSIEFEIGRANLGQ